MRQTSQLVRFQGRATGKPSKVRARLAKATASVQGSGGSETRSDAPPLRPMASLKSSAPDDSEALARFCASPRQRCSRQKPARPGTDTTTRPALVKDFRTAQPNPWTLSCRFPGQSAPQESALSPWGGSALFSCSSTRSLSHHPARIRLHGRRSTKGPQLHGAEQSKQKLARSEHTIAL